MSGSDLLSQAGDGELDSQSDEGNDSRGQGEWLCHCGQESRGQEARIEDRKAQALLSEFGVSYASARWIGYLEAVHMVTLEVHKSSQLAIVPVHVVAGTRVRPTRRRPVPELDRILFCIWSDKG